MKVKWLIGLLLVVSALLAWTIANRQHGQKGARPIKPPAFPMHPALASSFPKIAPINQPRLVTISRQSIKLTKEIFIPFKSNFGLARIVADTQASYGSRLEAIANLGNRLSGQDWAVLKKFLLQPDSLDKVQPEQIIKNRLMDSLCAMNPPLQDLADVLSQVCGDTRQNEVTRDYAVQHLATFYDLAEPRLTDLQREAIRNVLWGALDETGDSIAGTALLDLIRLSKSHADFDPIQVSSAALNLAADDSAGELTHITALEVCAQLGLRDALPLALATLRSGGSIATQMSAIAVIGQIGNPTQIPLLESVALRSDDQLKPAVLAALQLLKNKKTL